MEDGWCHESNTNCDRIHSLIQFEPGSRKCFEPTLISLNRSADANPSKRAALKVRKIMLDSLIGVLLCCV
jgi:hypothetical protein